MPLKCKRAFPNSLRIYRRRQNIRIVDVAGLLKVTDAALISHWENGRRLPSLKNALKLSAITQCPLEILYLDLFRVYQQQFHPQKD